MSKVRERMQLYLDTLREDPSRTAGEVCAVVGVSVVTRAAWRKHKEFGDWFRSEEDQIRAVHKAQKRQLAEAQAALEEAGADEQMSPAMEQYLADLREEDGDRIKACSRSGCSWLAVESWLRVSPEFNQRFSELYVEHRVQAVDKLSQLARNGKSFPALKTYLQAEMPDKYGKKIQVSHDHTIRLEAGDSTLVDEKKRSILQRYRGAIAAKVIRSLPAVAGEVAMEAE